MLARRGEVVYEVEHDVVLQNYVLWVRPPAKKGGLSLAPALLNPWVVSLAHGFSYLLVLTVRRLFSGPAPYPRVWDLAFLLLR